MAEPLLITATDRHLLSQGLQKLINECDDHSAKLVTGQQNPLKDPDLKTLTDFYRARRQKCTELKTRIGALPVVTERERADHSANGGTFL
jgi:hypothetical protein